MGPDVIEPGDWHVALCADLARVTGDSKEIIMAMNRLICVPRRFSEIDACQFQQKEKRAVRSVWFFLSPLCKVSAVAAIRQNCQTFKRFSDARFFFFFAADNVINFIGHLMRARRKEKERDALRSLCCDVQTRNGTAAIRYPTVYSTPRGPSSIERWNRRWQGYLL